MSSVLLKQDHDGKKAGTVVSVPFGVGQSMVAGGIGEYPASPPTIAPAAPAPTAADRYAAEVAKLKAAHAAAVAEAGKAHADEMTKLKAELDAANKVAADLQTQLKSKK